MWASMCTHSCVFVHGFLSGRMCHISLCVHVFVCVCVRACVFVCARACEHVGVRGGFVCPRWIVLASVRPSCARPRSACGCDIVCVRLRARVRALVRSGSRPGSRPVADWYAPAQDPLPMKLRLRCHTVCTNDGSGGPPIYCA